MRKRWLAFFVLGLFLIVNLSGSVIAAQQVTVTIDGKELHLDVPPVIENGRVIVPLRIIFEALDSNVDWNDVTKTVIATKGNDIVKLTVGKKIAYRNGASIELDVCAKVINGRILVPLRFVSEALGARVEWDGQKSNVTINQAQQNLYINKTEGTSSGIRGNTTSNIANGGEIVSDGDKILYVSVANHVQKNLEEDGLYKIDENCEIVKISNHTPKSLNIDDNTLYFADNGIFSIQTTGQGLKKLASEGNKVVLVNN